MFGGDRWLFFSGAGFVIVRGCGFFLWRFWFGGFGGCFLIFFIIAFFWVCKIGYVVFFWFRCGVVGLWVFFLAVVLVYWVYFMGRIG